MAGRENKGLWSFRGETVHQGLGLEVPLVSQCESLNTSRLLPEGSSQPRKGAHEVVLPTWPRLSLDGRPRPSVDTLGSGCWTPPLPSAPALSPGHACLCFHHISGYK